MICRRGRNPTLAVVSANNEIALEDYGGAVVEGMGEGRVAMNPFETVLR